MKEQDIQRKIVQWLTLKGCHVLKYNVNGYGKAGEPDLICALPNGNGTSFALFIEVKNETGKLSELQKAKLNKLREEGHLALVTRDVRAIGVYLTKNGVKLPQKTELPLYSRYKSMIRRCYAPTFKYYADYGGRGITVCDRWREPSMGYYNFIEDMGLPKSPHSTIDRIDNDKGYSPDNCQWADPYVQANNKRSNRIITANGRSLSISQWARESGINYYTILSRIEKGWNPEKAVTLQPKLGRNQYGDDNE